MVLCTGSTLLNFLGVVTALVAVAYAYFKWTYQYWKNRNVPHLEPKIPWGNLGFPFKVGMGERMHDMYKTARAKGWKYCGIYTMLSPGLLVVDLDLVKLILTKDFQNFPDRGLYTNEKVDPVGAHLFSIGGSRWKHLRAKLTPTFTSGKLKSMFQTLVDCGLVMEKYIEENIKSDEPVDIKNILACFSTDIIGSCAFGLECNSFKEPDSLFRQYGNRIFEITRWRAIRMLFAGNFPGLAKLIGMRTIPKDMSDFFIKMVDDTVSYRQKNNVVRKDFLQLLIDLRKEGEEDGQKVPGNTDSLTLEEMVAQSFVFFAAGFETSSTTMTFALFELAINPDIQDRVREEIKTVLAKNDNKVSYDSLSEMKYLTQVIDETLRIHSPARMLRRVCIADYKVPGEDLVIEKDTKIFISIKGGQYDEEYWENPTVFDPERFTEEKKKNMNHYKNMPFGQGPRNCIGERFGVMQVKVGLTCLLRKFKVRLNERTKLPLKMSAQSIVASAEGGIWLNLEKI